MLNRIAAFMLDCEGAWYRVLYVWESLRYGRLRASVKLLGRTLRMTVRVMDAWVARSR